MESGSVATAGPVFSSSRVIKFSDLPSDEQESFVRFFAEQKVQVSSRSRSVYSPSDDDCTLLELSFDYLSCVGRYFAEMRFWRA